jgi:hypothetical protein
MHNVDFEHRNQDSRQSLAEQIMAQFERQAEMERRLEHEETMRQGTFREAA